MKGNFRALLFAALIATLVFAGCSTESEQKDGDAMMEKDGDAMEMDAMEKDGEAMEEKEAKVPLKGLDVGVYYAVDEYEFVSFEEGEGTCLDMGFPTDLVYGPGNVIRTLDDNYADDWTFADVGGRIKFSALPLDSGEVNCEAETSNNTGKADVTCTEGEDDAETEVCTAKFTLYANS